MSKCFPGQKTPNCGLYVMHFFACIVCFFHLNRRRWSNIVPTLGQCIVFAGIGSIGLTPDSLHILILGYLANL